MTSDTSEGQSGGLAESSGGPNGDASKNAASMIGMSSPGLSNGDAGDRGYRSLR